MWLMQECDTLVETALAHSQQECADDEWAAKLRYE